jgi:hypothetical protein
LQQSHIELAYASRLAARCGALVDAAFARKRFIDMMPPGDTPLAISTPA